MNSTTRRDFLQGTATYTLLAAAATGMASTGTAQATFAFDDVVISAIHDDAFDAAGESVQLTAASVTATASAMTGAPPAPVGTVSSPSFATSSLTTFQWQVGNTGGGSAGSGAGAGKATFGDVIVDLGFDAAAVQLLRFALNGAHIASITVTRTTPAGDDVYALADVTVHRLQVEATGAAGELPAVRAFLSPQRVTRTVGTTTSCLDLSTNANC